jgi:hypothetical protein
MIEKFKMKHIEGWPITINKYFTLHLQNNNESQEGFGDNFDNNDVTLQVK